MVLYTVIGVLLVVAPFSSQKSFGNDVKPRIISGSPARAGQFPFAAAIYKTTEHGKYFCGGALVSNLWVLTAGTCVENAVSFSIQLGANTLTSSDLNRVIVSANVSYLHPEYNNLTLENDVGLIQLSETVVFTDYISPIFLPSTDLQHDADTVSIGWGQVDDYHPGPVEHLNFANVVTLEDADCRAIFQDQIAEAMFCVQGNRNEGTCLGDFGTPLVRYILNDRHAEHVGISTFISTNGCESLDPSGYTKTYPYVDWIRNVTDIP